jgi:hypothetical protein
MVSFFKKISRGANKFFSKKNMGHIGGVLSKGLGQVGNVLGKIGDVGGQILNNPLTGAIVGMVQPELLPLLGAAKLGVGLAKKGSSLATTASNVVNPTSYKGNLLENVDDAIARTHALATSAQQPVATFA